MKVVILPPSFTQFFESFIKLLLCDKDHLLWKYYDKSLNSVEETNKQQINFSI